MELISSTIGSLDMLYNIQKKNKPNTRSNANNYLFFMASEEQL